MYFINSKYCGVAMGLPITKRAEVPAAVLSREAYEKLANVPGELEWLANFTSLQTRRAYKNDLKLFLDFLGKPAPGEIQSIAPAHVLAWRNYLVSIGLAETTIRRKLSAIASLFDFLLDRQEVKHNPVNGVRRPPMSSQEGKTPAISDEMARRLLEAPESHTLKGKRDRAILSVLMFHGLRREELCSLNVGDIQLRRGVAYLVVTGKGGKIRYLPLHPGAAARITDYLDQAGHVKDLAGPLFRPVKKGGRSDVTRRLTADGVYCCVVKYYGHQAGLNVPGFCVHSLRATAATNALENNADIAKVQEWLGHANISTTRLYDRRATRPEDSPTFRVKY